jgi:hypothetical protein
MSGIRDNNRTGFIAANIALENSGVCAGGKIYNPAIEVPGYATREMAMAYDLKMLTTYETVEQTFVDDKMRIYKSTMAMKPLYDCVCLLNGWMESEGSKIEVSVARYLGIKVMTIDQLLSGFQFGPIDRFVDEQD